MFPTRTGWAFPHTTLVLRQVFPRTPFENEFAGIHTVNKARENERNRTSCLTNPRFLNAFDGSEDLTDAS